jgi:hypothetical protein
MPKLMRLTGAIPDEILTRLMKYPARKRGTSSKPGTPEEGRGGVFRIFESLAIALAMKSRR